MDSLVENLVDILCGRKMVCISPLGRESFIVYRYESRLKSGIITMMKSRKCLVNECTTFLAYVINAKKENRAVTNILVV